jgi:hypothetical protein
METGLLWFDDSPAALSERVRRAAAYYAQKFGRSPTLCLVHPDMIERQDRAVAGIQLRGARTVMPNHFYLGEELRASNGKQNGRGRGTKATSGGRAQDGRPAKTGPARKRLKDGSAAG